MNQDLDPSTSPEETVERVLAAATEVATMTAAALLAYDRLLDLVPQEFRGQLPEGSESIPGASVLLNLLRSMGEARLLTLHDAGVFLLGSLGVSPEHLEEELSRGAGSESSLLRACETCAASSGLILGRGAGREPDA